MDKSITHQALVQLSEVFKLAHMHHRHHHGNENAVLLLCFQGLKRVILFVLSAGSHHTETRNNPPGKEAGAVHGPEPSMFVCSLVSHHPLVSFLNPALCFCP